MEWKTGIVNTNLRNEREFLVTLRCCFVSQNSRGGARMKNNADGRIDKIVFSKRRVKSNLPVADGPKLVSSNSAVMFGAMSIFDRVGLGRCTGIHFNMRARRQEVDSQ